MILFRFNDLNILIDMSLTKAAEVLNKILHNETSIGSIASTVPPVLMPPECKNSHMIDNQKTTESNHLSPHVQNVYLQYSGYKVNKGSSNNLNENSFVNVSQSSATNVSSDDDDDDSTTNEKDYIADLNVVTVPHNSSLIPFLERFFKLKKNSDNSLNDPESDEFTPLDPNKYKTELCRSYQVHGYCKYGIRCNYAHGLTQIKVAYRHGKYKTRNCQSYHESGFCRYGARCSFIHDAEEGILKCPITDREVLEALHYRPMSEFHHIATITWRMIENDSYPPTEVHFFTPSVGNQITEFSDDLFYKNPLYLDKLLIEDLETTEMCSEMFKKDHILCNKPQDKDNKSRNTQMDQNKSSCLRGSLSAETSSENLKNSEILNSQQSASNGENYLCERFNEVEVTNQISTDSISLANKNKDNENEAKNFSRNSKSLSNPSGDNKKSYDNSRPWTKNINTVEKYSNYSFSFNLNDLLNCLKTREGQQHLASWASEAERRNSCSTTDSSLSQRSSPDFSYKRQTVRSGRDLSKYKTELCRSYQYNKYCEYNESCLYAHGTQDLRSYPKHPLYRSKKCFSFHKKGFCLYGSRCQFLHDVEIPFL